MRRLVTVCLLAVTTPALGQPAGLPPIAIENNRILVGRSSSISTDILFEVGEPTLLPTAAPLLDAIGKTLARSRANFVIEVHSDDTAPDSDRTGAFVGKLSQWRADAIKKYLARRGVAGRRMIARGSGSTTPLAPNTTEDGRRMNRRVQIVIDAEVRGPVASDLDAYTKRLPGRGAKLVATITTTQGTLTCELFADRAPMTVANFVGLATGAKAWLDPTTGAVRRGKPLYDGTTFHRVIPEFMIQGGDPLGTGRGGPGYSFSDEQTAIGHEAGSLAMANAGPNTNGSQFYITEGAPTHLDTRHVVFGRCAELDVIAEIARVPRDGTDRPTTPVTIQKITVTKRP